MATQSSSDDDRIERWKSTAWRRKLSTYCNSVRARRILGNITIRNPRKKPKDPSHTPINSPACRHAP